MRSSSIVFYAIKHNKIEELKLLLNNGFLKNHRYKFYNFDDDWNHGRGTKLLTMSEYAQQTPCISNEIKDLIKN